MRGIVSISMKIITFNIRGLGGLVKKKEIQKVVREQKPDLLCVQETKIGVVDRLICAQLWDCDDFQWVFKSANGSTGGLLMAWNPSSFVMSDFFEGDYLLGVEGR